MHDKDQAIAPPFREILGVEVIVPPDLDTDTLGTFSGEVARRGTMGEVAEAKARLGMSSAGLGAGLASEGSFGPHPASPFVSAGMELLVFVDDDLGLRISESLVDTSPCFDQLVVANDDKLADFLERVAFPEHALIVVPNEGVPAGGISKGIRDRDALSDAIARARSASSDDRARVETDMRAHMNPTRMATLRRLAEQLARRLAADCPACGAPGFGTVDVETGLPCEWCGMPTELVRHEIMGCARCNHREQRPRPDGLTHSDPGYCPRCNP